MVPPMSHFWVWIIAHLVPWFSQYAATAAALSVLSKASIWCRAEIDYSAVNEYMRAHYYDNEIPHHPYFRYDRNWENIYNARQGVYDPISKTWKPIAKLTECGFQLVVTDDESVTTEAATMIDWNQLDPIRNIVLPRIENAVRNAYENNPIEQVIFWCPTLRLSNTVQSSRTLESSKTQTPRASYVATAHIDTDVNAYESISQLIDLIHKNRFPGTEFDKDHIVDLLDRETRRFSIVNAWQNIGIEPIRHAPLAFLSSRYADSKHHFLDHVRSKTYFPHSSPDPVQSLWYTYPSMKANQEFLLFAQYDRNATVPSDLWHCALTNMELENPNETNSNKEPRQSFDVRCLVIFKETMTMDNQMDRIQNRRVPRLDFAASQQFCSEQAVRRQQIRK